ncbi:MAG TPA: hypothetical protein VKU02_25635 [Gemmataceae bacterium]|nr:hypothetical protein [Gemmataceae bacterium]
MALRRMSVLVLAFAALFWAGSSASAQTVTSLFFDNFESYNLGDLDKNDIFPTGTNLAPNGMGNPWFGPESGDANGLVINAETGPEGVIMPFSGVQMLRGQPVAGRDLDQNWYNLAYRLNNGAPFMENIILDWQFYDPFDPNDPNVNPTDFRDYIALGFYDTAPPTTDAPDNYNLNVGFQQIQRISLGAGPNITAVGFDPTVYQARIVGADDSDLASGWFNSQTPRSLGWHHGMIVIGPMHDPANGDFTNDVTFYIDDLTTPTVGPHTSVSNFGYNVIEINTKFGAQTGYFDDINFSVVTP